jgi:hypothetical protein
MASGANRSFVGAYLGNGEATQVITVPGFKPRHIRIVSYATGSEVENFEGMPELGAAKAGGFLRRHSATGPVVADVATVTVVSPLTAAEGVSFSDGGFTVGNHASVNSSGVQYLYVCTD